MTISTDRATLSLTAAWLINSLAYSIIYPFIPLYLHQDRGFPMTQVGMIFPLMGLATILAPPLFGALTDRFGRRPVMQLGQHGRAAVFLLLALAAWMQSPFVVFAGLLMVSTAIGCGFQVAAQSYLADITTPEKRSLYYGWTAIGCNIGWAVGPILGSCMTGVPFYLLFLLTAILCSAGGAVSFLLCPEPDRQTAGAKQSAFAFVGVLTNRALLELLFAALLLTMLTSQLYSTLSVFATGNVGIPRNRLCMDYSANGFTVICCQQAMTHLLERLKVPASRRLMLGAGLYIAGYFAMGFCTGAWYMAGCVFVLTLGEITVQPGLYSATAKLVTPDMLGRAMAARSLVTGIGFSIGPWFGALVYARCQTSPVLLWAILASFGLAAAIGFFRTGRTLDRGG